MPQLKTTDKEYKTMVEQASPNSRIFADCLRAFIVGGVICSIGQLIQSWLGAAGLSNDDAALYTTVILVFSAALLTGLGLYEKIGKFGGAGSVVPITGFSNAVAAPAVEFKKEGLVLGVGAKMFIIAGPVVVYGTLTATLIGLIYYFVK